MKDQILIEVQIKPVSVSFCRDDFETNEEWEKFVEELKQNDSFAFDHFIDNIDWDQKIENQNPDDWEMKIK